MKKFKFNIRGHEYEVSINNVEDSVVDVDVNGSHYQVEILREMKQPKTPILTRTAVRTHKPIKKNPTIVSKGSSVRCPLPGNIMQIFVKEGDQVKKGDKLLMYEAMKMENVILSEIEGIVNKIKVQTGDTVQQDEVLLEIN